MHHASPPPVEGRADIAEDSSSEVAPSSDDASNAPAEQEEVTVPAEEASAEREPSGEGEATTEQAKTHRRSHRSHSSTDEAADAATSQEENQ